MFWTEPDLPSENNFFESLSEEGKNRPLLQNTKVYKEDDSEYNWEYDSYSRKLVQSFVKFKFPAQTFQQTIESQLELNKDEAHHIDACDNNPELFILPDAVLVTAEKVGKGSYSSVFRTHKYSCNGSSISTRIVKLAERTFLSEYDLLRQHLNADALKSPYIDHIHACYSVLNSNMHLAIFENSDADLAHADYNKVASPFKFLATQLTHIVEGIKLLHESNLAHRDIKGENCLINYQGIAKITDTGFVHLIPDKELHRTNYTPHFAPPFIWNSLQDQANNEGHQGKDADVFAIGMTIEYDGIIQALNHCATNLLDENPVLFQKYFELQQKIMNAREEVPVNSKEEVLALGKDYPGRVSLINRIVLIFPDRHELLKNTRAAIQLFAHHISVLEINRLKQLAELAHKLINYNSNVIPSIAHVKKDLDNICNLKMNESTALKSVNINLKSDHTYTARPLKSNPSTKNNDSFEEKENRKTSSPSKTKKRMPVQPVQISTLKNAQEQATKKMKTLNSPENVEGHL